jgi:hypothetical protein
MRIPMGYDALSSQIKRKKCEKCEEAKKKE